MSKQRVDLCLPCRRGRGDPCVMAGTRLACRVEVAGEWKWSAGAEQKETSMKKKTETAAPVPGGYRRCTLAKHHVGEHDPRPAAGRRPCGALVHLVEEAPPSPAAPGEAERAARAVNPEIDKETERRLLTYLADGPEAEKDVLDNCAGSDPDERALHLRVLEAMLERGLVALTLVKGCTMWCVAPESEDEAELEAPASVAAPVALALASAPAPADAEQVAARAVVDTIFTEAIQLDESPPPPPRPRPARTDRATARAERDARFERLMVEARTEREAREAAERAKGRDMAAPLEAPGRKAGELDRGLVAENLLHDAGKATHAGGVFYETPIGRAYRVLLDRYQKEKAKPVQLGLFTRLDASGNGGNLTDPPTPIASNTARA